MRGHGWTFCISCVLTHAVCCLVQQSHQLPHARVRAVPPQCAQSTTPCTTRAARYNTTRRHECWYGWRRYELMRVPRATRWWLCSRTKCPRAGACNALMDGSLARIPRGGRPLSRSTVSVKRLSQAVLHIHWSPLDQHGTIGDGSVRNSYLKARKTIINK